MTDDKKPLLATGDKTLIQAAATGDGLIPLTPDLLQKIGDGLRELQADIAARFPKLVEECSYETRLAIVAWTMEHIVAHATEGGTFRYLIYKRLGFDPDAYVPLYMAGGMTISNEFDLSPTSKQGSQDHE